MKSLCSSLDAIKGFQEGVTGAAHDDVKPVARGIFHKFLI